MKTFKVIITVLIEIALFYGICWWGDFLVENFQSQWWAFPTMLISLVLIVTLGFVLAVVINVL